MAKKSTSKTLIVPLNLLLLAVISALFVIFTYLLLQRPVIQKDLMPQVTPQPVSSLQDLDATSKDLDSADTTSEMSIQLQKLSSDSAGF